ncbi:non-classical arabinogalactan protein 31-like [Rhododendron vialii]|uniref:non-classical arabinogalactan protein 31-like n=1 Tax=Rhododendron vialii TaxID=182163 RepID=UPI00265DA0B9|nr:non-classical arabinogalactan protein 31-like [Rhododendron vialii]
MAIIPLLKGLVFLLSCITVFGDHAPIHRPVESPKYPKSHPHHHHHHHEGHPPSPPPAHPPTQHHKGHSPSPPLAHPSSRHNEGHPPSPPPAHPPSHAPHPRRRSPVAVQGVVYCKPCKYRGIDTLWEATPLLGAVVKLECNNTKQPREWYGKTDKNGYFLITVEKKLSSFGAHSCKLYLVSSPSPACKKPTDLLHGEKGALLRWPQKPSKFPFELFTVGPFAFEPYNKCL